MVLALFFLSPSHNILVLLAILTFLYIIQYIYLHTDKKTHQEKMLLRFFQSGMIKLNNHFKYPLPTDSGTQPNITLWISTPR